MPKEKPQARLERSTFVTSRQLEYFTPDELEKQIAYPRNVWPLAITKELVDNGLDACEAIPVNPQITVTLEGDRISVADNAGPGLPQQTLERSQDYAVTVSNKAHYKSPLRGRQGNALKTVWAAPFVYNGGCQGDGKGRIEVITPSYAVEVVASLNRIRQEPDLKTSPLELPFVTAGTVVSVDWIQVAGYQNDGKRDFYKTVLDLLQSYALFNPHAGFQLIHGGTVVEVAKPITASLDKWLPSYPTSPHWYDLESLSNLIGAEIINGNGQKTVREFVSEFAGLTSPIKQKNVTTAADLARQRLDDLVVNEGAAIDSAAVQRLLNLVSFEDRALRRIALR